MHVKKIVGASPAPVPVHERRRYPWSRNSWSMSLSRIAGLQVRLPIVIAQKEARHVESDVFDSAAVPYCLFSVYSDGSRDQANFSEARKAV